MKTFGVIVVGFAVLAFSFVLFDDSICAQEVKDEKKTEEKKDDKKPEEKKVSRLPDYSTAISGKKKVGKIRDVKTGDAGEMTIVLIDEAEFGKFREWEVKHRGEVLKDIAGTKDVNAKKDKVRKFEAEKATKYDKVFAGEDLTVSINESSVRFRSAFVPKVYNDKNEEKKLTPAQVQALRTPPSFPGYITKAENLRIGQVVEVWLKPPPPSKAPTTPVVKKGPIGADPKDTGTGAPPKNEIYMLQILQEAQ